MITPVSQVQPQFRAKFYSGDISILANEAKRTLDPNKSMLELAEMLDLLKTFKEKKASLIYRTKNSEKPDIPKFSLLLDGKRVGSSDTNFTEALKNLFKKRNKAGDIISLQKVNANNIGRENLQKYAFDA